MTALPPSKPLEIRQQSKGPRLRIAFGERAGERVQCPGSGFGAEGEAPTLTGTRCAYDNTRCLSVWQPSAASLRVYQSVDNRYRMLTSCV